MQNEFDDEPKPPLSLSQRKTRKAVVAVGQSSIRLMDQDAYRRRLNQTINLAPWKRQQFSNKDVACVICGWKPPVFLTKSHVRTFLTIHHMIPVADGGTDSPDNLIILCPNCHSIADYLPSIIVLPAGYDLRPTLIRHLQLLNSDPADWKRQFDAWSLRQKRNAVYSLRDNDGNYDGSLEPFYLE